MNNLIIFIIIIILLIIFLHRLCIKQSGKLEHLTPESDEAIQNVASLYNANKMTIGQLNSTGDVNAAGNVNVTGKVVAGQIIQAPSIQTPNGSIDTLSTGQIKLGNKWILSGGKDTGGSDDYWLRFLSPAGQYYGGIAASTFYDTSMANTIKGYIDGGFGTVGSMKNIKDNTRCPDGWDLTGEFGTGSLDDCGNRCRASFPTALCAQYRKSDGHCWCKSVMGFQPGTDTNFQAKLIPY